MAEKKQSPWSMMDPLSLPRQYMEAKARELAPDVLDAVGFVTKEKPEGVEDSFLQADDLLPISKIGSAAAAGAAVMGELKRGIRYKHMKQALGGISDPLQYSFKQIAKKVAEMGDNIRDSFLNVKGAQSRDELGDYLSPQEVFRIRSLQQRIPNEKQVTNVVEINDPKANFYGRIFKDGSRAEINTAPELYADKQNPANFRRSIDEHEFDHHLAELKHPGYRSGREIIMPTRDDRLRRGMRVDNRTLDNMGVGDFEQVKTYLKHKLTFDNSLPTWERLERMIIDRAQKGLPFHEEWLNRATEMAMSNKDFMSRFFGTYRHTGGLTGIRETDPDLFASLNFAGHNPLYRHDMESPLLRTAVQNLQRGGEVHPDYFKRWPGLWGTVESYRGPIRPIRIAPPASAPLPAGKVAVSPWMAQAGKAAAPAFAGGALALGFLAGDGRRSKDPAKDLAQQAMVAQPEEDQKQQPLSQNEVDKVYEALLADQTNLPADPLGLDVPVPPGTFQLNEEPAPMRAPRRAAPKRPAPRRSAPRSVPMPTPTPTPWDGLERRVNKRLREREMERLRMRMRR